MGRLELRIPLTEVVTIEEDLRRGVMLVVVEGPEYPTWQVGNEAMGMNVNSVYSWPDMSKEMVEIEERRIRLIREAKELTKGGNDGNSKNL